MFDAKMTDAVMTALEHSVLDELSSGLERLGFAAVPEDSFGILALRVVDEKHVGTAYVEFRDGSLRVRIVLQQDRASLT
jgi:hypothetical protein